MSWKTDLLGVGIVGGIGYLVLKNSTQIGQYIGSGVGNLWTGFLGGAGIGANNATGGATNTNASPTNTNAANQIQTTLTNAEITALLGPLGPLLNSAFVGFMGGSTNNNAGASNTIHGANDNNTAAQTVSKSNPDTNSAAGGGVYFQNGQGFSSAFAPSQGTQISGATSTPGKLPTGTSTFMGPYGPITYS